MFWYATEHLLWRLRCCLEFYKPAFMLRSCWIHNESDSKHVPNIQTCMLTNYIIEMLLNLILGRRGDEEGDDTLNKQHFFLLCWTESQ